VLYGPFRFDGAELAASNVRFEQWLHSLDERFGIRRLPDIVREAEARGLALERVEAMPANNHLLCFVRR